jgi:hypothetical protein
MRGYETVLADHIDEGGIAMIKLPFDIANAEAKAKGGRGPASVREEDLKALENFVSGVPISVADPTDTSNVTPTAREPREADYHVVESR